MSIAADLIQTWLGKIRFADLLFSQDAFFRAERILRDASAILVLTKPASFQNLQVNLCETQLWDRKAMRIYKHIQCYELVRIDI